MNDGGAPTGVDLVALFLDIVESARPATPAVVVEHPDRIIVHADANAVRALLAGLVDLSLSHADHRAEIRLELGARPGCSFFLRDNGNGTIGEEESGPLMLLAGRAGTRIRFDNDPGWGSTAIIRLAPSTQDDVTHRAAYTGDLPRR